MLVNNVPMKAELEIVDSLTETIQNSILGVENLRTENRRLKDKLESLEGDTFQLENEVRSLKTAFSGESRRSAARPGAPSTGLPLPRRPDSLARRSARVMARGRAAGP